jgi:hypothetical protein
MSNQAAKSRFFQDTFAADSEIYLIIDDQYDFRHNRFESNHSVVFDSNIKLTRFFQLDDVFNYLAADGDVRIDSARS